MATLTPEEREYLESQGADYIRALMASGNLHNPWTVPAALWLAELDAAETSKRDNAAKRIELAAWIAAVTGVLALVIAAFTAH